MTVVERPHGRVRYTVDGCRCSVCLSACREYNRWQRKQKAYGRPLTVSAAPVREHVNKLRAVGMGASRIARIAGVDPNVVSKLLYGIPSKGRPPSQVMYRDTARKILAVEPQLADGALVDSRPARRRLQALVATGWSITKLARQLGWHPANLAAAISQEAKVTVATDRAIRELYERLWDQAPPLASPRDRGAATKARKLAKTRGWLVPMWWDDERIDDPTPTETERPAVVRHMRSQGASARAIARVLHADMVTVRALIEEVAA